MSEKTNKSEWRDDAPLAKAEHDTLGRAHFAKEVANRLASLDTPESFVVGIYGIWGEGKTTLLNFIRNQIEEQHNGLTIWFNPWRMPSEEALVRYFIDELKSALGQSKVEPLQKLGEKTSDILKHFDNPSAKFLRGVVSLVASQELEKLKGELETALRDSKKRITIFVDDIDRLDTEEIRVVFRIIKLLGALPYTSFVLAFDDRLVSQSLAEKYPNSMETGQNFLEKIIQVPLTIPRVKKLALRQLCFRMLENIIDTHQITLTSEEQQRFAIQFQNSLDARLKTPRLAKQYANVLRFSLPMLRGEVNVVDLMLIEGIKVFFPAVHEAIRNNLSMFAIDRTGELYGGKAKGLQEKVLSLLEGPLAQYPTKEADELLSLIYDLFPRLEGSREGGDWEEVWRKDKRICSSKYSDRYFAYGLGNDEISDIEFEELIVQVQNSSFEDGDAKIDAWVTRNNAEEFIERLRLHEKAMTPELVWNVGKSIATKGDRYPNPPQMFNFMNAFSQAGIFVSQMIENLQDDAEKGRFCREILTTAMPLSFASELFRWIRVGKDEREKGETRYPGEDEEKELAAVLINRLKEYPIQKPFFSENNHNVGLMLGIWSHWGDREELKQYLKDSLENNSKLIDPFLFGFCGMSYGSNGATPYFDAGQYESIKEIVEPQLVLDSIASLDLDKSKHPEILKRFIEIHEHRKETEETD